MEAAEKTSETRALLPQKSSKLKYSWFNMSYDPRPRSKRPSSAAIFDAMTFGGFSAAALIQTIEEVNIPVHFLREIDVFAAEVCKIVFMSFGSLSLAIDFLKHEPNKWGLANKLFGIIAANLWVSTTYSFLQETPPAKIIRIISVILGSLALLSHIFQKAIALLKPNLLLREGAEPQTLGSGASKKAIRDFLLYGLSLVALLYHPLKEKHLMSYIELCFNSTNGPNITRILTEVGSQLNTTNAALSCTRASVLTGFFAGTQSLTLIGAAGIHLYNVLNSSEPKSTADKTLHTLGAIAAMTWVVADSLEPLLSPATEGFKFGSICVFGLSAGILLAKSIITAFAEKDVTEEVEFASTSTGGYQA